GLVDPTTWHRLQAAACESSRRQAGAVWHLDRLIVSQDGWREWLRRGEALATLGRRDRALLDLGAAIDKAPDSKEVWEARGRIHLNAGRWKEAIDDLTRALALNPKYTQLLEFARDIELASRVKDFGYASALGARGFAHAALENWKAANDDLRMAANAPDSTAAMHAHFVLLWLHLGRLDVYRKECQTLLINFDGQPGASMKFIVQLGPFATREVSNFQPPLAPADAALIAWTCSLAPGAVPPGAAERDGQRG